MSASEILRSPRYGWWLLWFSSSRLEMIFLKSFLLRDAKIYYWFFLLTTMWLGREVGTL